MLPRILKGFSVSVDGRGYIGRVETAKLPDLNITTEDFRAGGMDAPVEFDQGMEKLDCSLTFAEYDPDLIRLFGLLSANTPIVLRGAVQRQGEDAIGVVVRLTGGIKSITREDWSQGKKGSMTIVANCNKYTEEQDGVVLVDIDIINMKRIIGGTDQLAGQRALLGT
jgi:hypothetical protein